MTEKILIVDDESNILEIVSLFLERWGYTYAQAKNAAEARELLQKEEFALLLTDIKMPGESGLELTRYVKSTYPDMIVMFLSMLEDRDTAEAAMETGAYAYLTKPLRHNELQLFVQNGLQHRRLEMENRRYTQELEEKVKERTRELEQAVDDLQKSRQACQESEEKFRIAIEHSNDGILIHHKGRVLYVNAKFADIFGATSPEECVGQDISMYIHPDDLQRILDINARRFQGLDAPDRYEFLGRHRDGQAIDLEVSVTQTSYQDKSVTLAFFRDITSQKATRTALREAYVELENIFSAISSILIQITSSWRISQWNQQAAAFFGLQETEVVGKSLLDVPLSWDWARLQKEIDECRTKGHPIRGIELNFQRADGKKGLLGLSISPYFDEHDVFSGLVFMGADITERKNLESQLIQAQKLESIGQLAAGIAHEINTPIQYVGDNTRFFKEAFEELSLVLGKSNHLVATIQSGEDVSEAVEEAARAIEEADLEFIEEEIPRAIEQTLEGVERVSTIVRSMKDFSHPGGEEKVPVDINKALQNTGTITRNEWKYVAALEFDLEKDLPLVPCLAGEMNQAFLNIIINAAHAIADVVQGQNSEKGIITVTTQHLQDEVLIRITDTGKGIPQKSRPYVFDPFYTTKEDGKGTGQGLSLAYSTVVDKHDGSLTFETEEGQGTSFLIGLPINII
ncbi:MAG: PAS domain S-box protein [Desulfohalobiaceae bacterium]|nr:PAS domain S-box protein [Desulfohalobiaceae bacterium]